MKRNRKSVAEQHHDWLTQVETDGPFLALPVLKDIWPQGVERLGDADDRMISYKQAYMQWQRGFDTYSSSARTDVSKARYDAVNAAWIDLVLDQLAGWQDIRIGADDPRLAGISAISPGGEITLRPSGALEGRDGDLGALLLVVQPTTDLRANGLDGWAATDVDRLAMLLRKSGVEIGVVTDGQWWAIVWAKAGKPTGSGMVNALTWAEEPLLRDAFLTLIDQRRFRAKDTEQRLARLFERSELEAEVITEALGTQVRKSVELLVQAFSEARLAAAESAEADPLTEKPDDVYQAAVTIMMRVVFLLFAEERGMLPTEQLYWDSYAIRDLLDDLSHKAADGEEHLDETYDAWHRLLSVSQALFNGVNFDEMRMPAYGGSLLDPARFPWLYATDDRGLRLKVSDRVMLHVLDSVQTVEVSRERRRISFRDIDVEQIGYIYEGLLGYSCAVVNDEVVLGLVGKDGEEPEIDALSLQTLYDETADSRSFAAGLVEWIKKHQPAATSLSPARLAKLYDLPVTDAQRAEMRRLLIPVAAGDEELLGMLIDWSHFIRRDLRGIPLVVPVGGLVVVETPSRKNAGAHYTPRSLAEEVVKHALEPLLYEPGPLHINDEAAWNLKSSTDILDLKVADIAAGSGAFLVAAARFLASRVTEAWTEEGTLTGPELANPELARARAIREVIARCLYGADINPMAVEMCKLSLWLVSMDRGKPFTFVDDKVFCGNSLLGLTSLDQLRALHIYPDYNSGDDLLHELVDVQGKIAQATRLRTQLSSPVDEHNPMRSTRGKKVLLRQVRNATADLRLIADVIVAAALPLGGKSSERLDSAFKVLSWELAGAFSGGGATGDRVKIDERIKTGLAPTVQTDYESWRPLHWVLEAPDVIVERNGFDAVIGNPPFLGGKKLTPALGKPFREWLREVLARGVAGNADLVAYFFLRAFDLTRNGGSLGLIATNSVAQGESREVSLDQMLAKGFSLRRVIQSRPWPASTAVLDFAAVWGIRGPLPAKVSRYWGQIVVSELTSSLEPVGRVVGRPLRLGQNKALCFQGSNINGVGFTMSPAEAEEIRRVDSASAEVIRPFLNGDDLTSVPNQAARRWIVDFKDMDFDHVKAYPGALNWISGALRSHRSRLTNKPKLQQRWWVYERRAVGLYNAIHGMTEVPALSLVSKFVVPVRVNANQVFSHALGVFALNGFGDFAVLSSSLHFVWAVTWGSTLETRIRYTPSSVFETFPRPDITDRLAAIGEILHSTRSGIMHQRELGLTALYNLVHNPIIISDLDVLRMREIHVEIDAATIAAYGWQDVRLDYDFHTYRQMERWTISPAARVQILDRLLELNHARARNEGQCMSEQGEPA